MIGAQPVELDGLGRVVRAGDNPSGYRHRIAIPRYGSRFAITTAEYGVRSQHRGRRRWRPMFGQFVIDLDNACQLATTKGSVFAVRLLLQHAISTLLTEAASVGVVFGGQSLLIAAEDLRAIDNKLGRFDRDGLARDVLATGEITTLCGSIVLADIVGRQSKDPDTLRQHGKLVEAAEQVMTALTTPPDETEPPTPSTPIVPTKRLRSPLKIATMIVTGVAVVAVGAYLWRRSR